MGLFGSKKKTQGEWGEQAVTETLATVLEPELKKDLVTLKMVESVRVEGDKATVRLQITKPTAAKKVMLAQAVRSALEALEGCASAQVEFSTEVGGEALKAQGLTPSISNIIGVASGKGGVGKSTVALNLALSLAKAGKRVGILDADIYGPNIPTMLGLHDRPQVVKEGDREMMVPLERYGLKMISMGVLVPEDQAVIWRGPMLNSALKQFFGDVVWGELDYLIVDLPPGTGDVQISMVQLVQVTGCVLVSTPQTVSLNDARKAISMFGQTNTPVLGMIENMSYFICGKCGERHEIFDHGGAEEAAKSLNLPFLGAIPIGASVRAGGDHGLPITINEPDHEISKQFASIAQNLIETVDALQDEQDAPLSIKLGSH